MYVLFRLPSPSIPRSSNSFGPFIHVQIKYVNQDSILIYSFIQIQFLVSKMTLEHFLHVQCLECRYFVYRRNEDQAALIHGCCHPFPIRQVKNKFKECAFRLVGKCISQQNSVVPTAANSIHTYAVRYITALRYSKNIIYRVRPVNWLLDPSIGSELALFKMKMNIFIIPNIKDLLNLFFCYHLPFGSPWRDE